MEANYIISKSNHFILNSSYDLSLEEQRIILTLASMVQPSDEEFKPYKFKVKEFMDLLGLKTKTKYSTIPLITKELMKKVFEIKEGRKIIQVAWLSSAIHDLDEGSVTLEFSPLLKPYLLELGAYYTNYKLSNILQMKSKYSPRLYELLKMNEYNKKGFEIKIDELRRLFKAEEVYPLYADFKRRIILKTQSELEKNSDIRFEFKEIKSARKVDAIKFFVFENIKKVEPKKISNKKKSTKEKLADIEIKKMEENKKKASKSKDLRKDIIRKIEEEMALGTLTEKYLEDANAILLIKKLKPISYTVTDDGIQFQLDFEGITYNFSD